MSQRDAGWIQLYAETNQEAADLHVQAFKIAEEVSLPVMVCMDGFILTHAYEEVDIPEKENVQGFIPPFKPRQVLDPADPVSIGAMVGPEAFMEVRYMAHRKLIESKRVIERVGNEFAGAFGRNSGGLLHTYKTDGVDTVIVALGSVLGTIKDLVDQLENEGTRVGVIGITSFRPFPYEELHEALKEAKQVLIIEKAFQTSVGGIVTEDVRRSIRGLSIEDRTLIAGLGGRPITVSSLRDYVERALHRKVTEFEFLDLNRDLAEAELAKERA